jgi:hypothetical protein
MKNGLFNTASFPVLPEPVCFNVRLITRIDWTIFQKTNLLLPREIVGLPASGVTARGGGQKTVVWSMSKKLSDATTYVSGPVASAHDIQVSTAGTEKFQGVVNAQIFLMGGANTVSAMGGQGLRTIEVKLAGPAFSIARREQRGNKVKRLASELRLTFALPQSRSNSDAFHIVHLVTLNGQSVWVEDERAQFASHGSAVTRTIKDSGLYALVQVVGSTTEDEPQQSLTGQGSEKPDFKDFASSKDPQ